MIPGQQILSAMKKKTKTKTQISLSFPNSGYWYQYLCATAIEKKNIQMTTLYTPTPLILYIQQSILRVAPGFESWNCTAQLKSPHLATYAKLLLDIPKCDQFNLCKYKLYKLKSHHTRSWISSVNDSTETLHSNDTAFSVQQALT